MIKSKFQHMGEKEHYKMYKAGKTWLFAGIVALSLGTAMEASLSTPVQADTNDNETSTTSSNTASSAQPNQTTLPMDSGQTAISSAATSTASAQSTATSAASSAATAKKTTTPTSEIASDGSVATKTADTGSSHENAVTSDAGSEENNIKTSSTKETSASSATDSQQTKVASAASSATSAISTTSNGSTTNTDSKTQSQDQSQTKTSVAQMTAAIADISAVTKTPTSLTSAANSVASTTATTQVIQQLNQIDTKQLPTGTKVSITQDGTLVVNLPAGASANDIQTAKSLITAAKVKRAQITATDASTDNYADGVAAAGTVLANIIYSVGSSDNTALSDLIGKSLATLTAPTFADVSDNASITDPDAVDTVANKKAVAESKTWAANAVASLTWAEVSAAAAATSDVTALTGQAQQGYLDAIKAYAQGQMAADAYYLWLVKSTDKTANSYFYGSAGATEKVNGESKPWNTLLKTLQDVNDPSSVATAVQKYYSAGVLATAQGLTSTQQATDDLNTALGSGNALADGNDILDTIIAIFGRNPSVSVGTGWTSINAAAFKPLSTFDSPLVRNTPIAADGSTNGEQLMDFEKAIYNEAFTAY